MTPTMLIVSITVLYAAYNLLVKASGNAIGTDTVAPLLATISLQIAALSVSLMFLGVLVSQKAELSLPIKTYGWAILGGVCIGLAEVLYFYLFRGIAGAKPIEASVAIPLIVGGTILLSVLIARPVFSETLTSGQIIGVIISVLGLLVLALSSR